MRLLHTPSLLSFMSATRVPHLPVSTRGNTQTWRNLAYEALEQRGWKDDVVNIHWCGTLYQCTTLSFQPLCSRTSYARSIQVCALSSLVDLARVWVCGCMGMKGDA